MSKELFWLTLTTAMTGLFWLPYILDRIMVRGLMGAMATRARAPRRNRAGPSGKCAPTPMPLKTWSYSRRSC